MKILILGDVMGFQVEKLYLKNYQKLIKKK